MQHTINIYTTRWLHHSIGYVPVLTIRWIVPVLLSKCTSRDYTTGITWQVCVCVQCVGSRSKFWSPPHMYVCTHGQEEMPDSPTDCMFNKFLNRIITKKGEEKQIPILLIAGFILSWCFLQTHAHTHNDPPAIHLCTCTFVIIWKWQVSLQL